MATKIERRFVVKTCRERQRALRAEIIYHFGDVSIEVTFQSLQSFAMRN